MRNAKAIALAKSSIIAITFICYACCMHWYASVLFSYVTYRISSRYFFPDDSFSMKSVK